MHVTCINNHVVCHAYAHVWLCIYMSMFWYKRMYVCMLYGWFACAWAYVYMHMVLYMRLCTCVRKCMVIHLRTHMYACVHMCMFIHLRTHMYACMYSQAVLRYFFNCMYAFMHVRIQLHMHQDVRTFTFIHTQTSTHKDPLICTPNEKHPDSYIHTNILACMRIFMLAYT